MQFHYVVGYDTETNKWFVELDTTAYLVDGNVFYPDRADSAKWGYYGWHLPEDDSDEALLDQTLLNTLSYIVDTFPIPKESNA